MHANGTVYLIGAMVRKPSGTIDQCLTSLGSG